MFHHVQLEIETERALEEAENQALMHQPAEKLQLGKFPKYKVSEIN